MTGEIFVDGVDRLHSDILRIFSRLLESPDLSLDDDFFDRGGDSLLATELMLELRKMTGKELPDSLLFESSTVRSLAQRLSEKEAPQRKVAVRSRRGVRGREAAHLLPWRLDEGRVLRRAPCSQAGTGNFAHRRCSAWPRRRANSAFDRRDGGRPIAGGPGGAAERALPAGRALCGRNRGARNGAAVDAAEPSGGNGRDDQFPSDDRRGGLEGASGARERERRSGRRGRGV